MSEKHKFTPGPWKSFWANDNQTGLNPYTIGCPSGFPIAEVVQPDPLVGGDAAANARLIAAAPDLLTALIALADKADQSGPCDHSRASCEEIGCIGAQVAAARAAIAKATGGKP